MDQKLKNKILAYEKLILAGNAYNKCYFHMCYGDKEWEDVYKISPGFFSLARQSFQYQYFLILAKIYESSGRSDDNLVKLLNFVQSNNGQITMTKKEELNQLISDLNNKLSRFEDTIMKVMTFRDKVIAHNDKAFFDLEKRKNFAVDISYDDICSLFDFAGEVVNRLNYILYDSKSHLEYTNGEDFKSLMSFCLKNL
jgi:hypothetical protein